MPPDDVGPAPATAEVDERLDDALADETDELPPEEFVAAADELRPAVEPEAAGVPAVDGFELLGRADECVGVDVGFGAALLLGAVLVDGDGFGDGFGLVGADPTGAPIAGAAPDPNRNPITEPVGGAYDAAPSCEYTQAPPAGACQNAQ